jgi:hypothetical protein
MYSFRPEPDAADRDALVVALEGLLAGDEDRGSIPYRSAWRRAALEEGVSRHEADEPLGRLAPQKPGGQPEALEP